VFLELGFERASMDEVAARAATSKRTLYAHFGNKENLYREVVELVRGAYLARIGRPSEYSADPNEAVVLFLARVSQLVLWESVVRTCRLAISEAERLPDASRDYFDAMFGTAQRRLAEFLVTELDVVPERAESVTSALLARTVYAPLLATLFAFDRPIPGTADGTGPAGEVDLAAIRIIVGELLSDDLQPR
jgi:AcrR family transcriptional regulator